MNMQTGRIKLGPIVDIRGDGIWSPMATDIKAFLIWPWLDVDWLQMDYSCHGRDNDPFIVEKIIAELAKHKAGVKGPTKTPTEAEQRQLHLIHPEYFEGNSNTPLREGMEGVVIARELIFTRGLTEIREGTEIFRHAIGGRYAGSQQTLSQTIPGKGTLHLSFTDAATGITTPKGAIPFSGKGTFLLDTMLESQVKALARSTFIHALKKGKQHVYFATKFTNSHYDADCVTWFNEVFENERPAAGDKSFAECFKERDIQFYRGKDALIDAVAMLQNSPEQIKPGSLFVYLNYEGDILGNVLAARGKSIALMTSEITNEDGTIVLADPAHGTADAYNEDWKNDRHLMANPVAYIFAFARAIEHRAQMEQEPAATYAKKFAKNLRMATVETIEAGLHPSEPEKGFCTRDLVEWAPGANVISATELMKRIAECLSTKMRPTPGIRPAANETPPLP